MHALPRLGSRSLHTGRDSTARRRASPGRGGLVEIYTPGYGDELSELRWHRGLRPAAGHGEILRFQARAQLYAHRARRHLLKFLDRLESDEFICEAGCHELP